MISAVQK